MWVPPLRLSQAVILQARSVGLQQARLMASLKVRSLAVQQLAPSLQVLGLQVPELSARLQQVCLALALSALDLLRPDYWWQARTRLAQVQNPQMPAAPRPSPQP